MSADEEMWQAIEQQVRAQPRLDAHTEAELAAALRLATGTEGAASPGTTAYSARS